MLRPRPDIVLITIDSLRADHLGCFGYGKATSPNLDRFAGTSWSFTQAFSAGPNTPHAFPGIFASRSSLLSAKAGLLDAPVTLAEALQAGGYTTIGINAANPYLSRYFGYDRGFTAFYDFWEPGEESSPAGRTSSAPRRAGRTLAVPRFDLRHYLVSEENIRNKAQLEENFLAFVLDKLEHLTRPFFLWVHLMDTHFPYLPEEAAQLALGAAVFSDEEKFHLNLRVRESQETSPVTLRRIVQLYDAAIRQADAKVGALFSFLERRDLFDPAAILVCADHGEEFMEHGDLQHKCKLYDELLHVPLFIKHPFQKNGERSARLVSLLQLPSTVLFLAKLESAFDAPGLFSDRSEEAVPLPVFAEAWYTGNHAVPSGDVLFALDRMPRIAGLRSPRWKFIRDAGSGERALFNLISDPGETQNLWQREPEVGACFETLTTERLQRFDRIRVRRRVSELRQRLFSAEDHALRLPQ
ncbi:MAG: hypothetical protein D6743_04070 [Calditrichaeota bacterium]|nr:MAG: hypothetical protein D6743_04070 [Calditrichota bacterium]